jgi:hypothetical protein
MVLPSAMTLSGRKPEIVAPIKSGDPVPTVVTETRMRLALETGMFSLQRRCARSVYWLAAVAVAMTLSVPPLFICWKPGTPNGAMP